MHDGVASRLAPLLARILLGSADAAPSELPIRLCAWDGSEVGPAGAPAFVIRHRRALRRMLWKPGELGLVRAYIAGELDIEGDVFAALGAVQRVMRSGDEPIRLSSDDKREIVRTAVMLGAVGPEPKPPPEEFPRATGRTIGRRGRSADGPRVEATHRPANAHPAEIMRLAGAGTAHPAATGPAAATGHPAVAGHPAETAAFFAAVLGPTMAYGCALWDDAVDLDQAQQLAQDSIVSRLGLSTGVRLLDLSGGWGSFTGYAARRGARVVSLVRSPEQAEHVREQMSRVAPDGQVDIRIGDHQVAGDGPYDAVVGLAGVDQADALALDALASRLYDLLAPGGRLLIQQMVRRPGPDPVRRTFTASYLFPGKAELRPLGAVVTALEEAGLEIRGVDALREHHARTLRAWAANLQRRWDECGALATPGRARVWLLYLAASALACENGRIGVHEIYAIRRNRDGRAGDTLVEDRAILNR